MDPAARTPRRTAARLAVALVAGALMLSPVSGHPAHGAERRPCPGAGTSPPTAEPGDIRAAVLCLVNRERTERALRPLSAARDLDQAARGHAVDMVERGYFAHVSPGGSTPRSRSTQAGYAADRVSEAIGYGTGTKATPAGVVRMWMGSPAHRDLILAANTEHAGIGAADGLPTGRRRGATYTLLVASPR